MKALELKIPPLMLMAICAGLMAALADAFPMFSFEAAWGKKLAQTLLYSGAVFVASGIHVLRQYRTTLNPLAPASTSTLVVAGIYCLSRNPMYLGFLLCLAAFASALSNTLVFFVLPLFVLYMNRFQIKPEERALSAKYGAEFSDYCTKVRRWL